MVMTRSLFLAVLVDGDVMGLSTLDVALVEEHTSRDWRSQQAAQVEVLNKILTDSKPGAI